MRFVGFSVLPIFLVNFSLFVLAQGVVAATITSVGIEEGSEANGYSPQNWSNPGVAKSYDLSGERYGTAGYYQIRPMPWDPGSANIPSVSVGAGNDLGISQASNPTLSSAPVFLGSITGGAGQYVNYGGYPIVRGPDGSALYRQGALSVSVNNGPYDSPAGANASYFGLALQFTLGADANFRIGLAVDSVGTGEYAPDYVGIYNNSTGTVFSTALTRNGSLDMVFFDISGVAGESFTVALWQNAGTHAVAALSLVTFDMNQPSDTSPPVINLNGFDPVIIDWGDNYIDAGASVTDDVDAPRTISGVGSVDTSRPGTYSITFDATDVAGNAATQVVRTVLVSPPSNSPGADGLSGVLRYAFGGQGPNDPVAKPILTQSNGSLVLTAIVRTNDPSLEVVGQWVTNLANYPTLPAGSNEVTGVPAADTNNVPAGCQRQVFAVSPGSDGKKFLRLKTTLSP